MAKKKKNSSRLLVVFCLLALSIVVIAFGLTYNRVAQNSGPARSTEAADKIVSDRIIYDKMKRVGIETKHEFWQSSLDGKQREVIPSITQTLGYSIPTNDPVVVVASSESAVVLSDRTLRLVESNTALINDDMESSHTVSPDGKKIAYMISSLQGNNTVMLMNSDGSDQHVLFDNTISGFPLRPETKHGQEGWLVPVQWSSDSQKIFLKNTAGGELTEYQLASFDLQTKKFTLIKTSKYPGFFPSPSGKLIAYQEYEEKWDKDTDRPNVQPKQPLTLIIENLSTKQKRKIPLPGNISLGVWSPDDQSIAVASYFYDVGPGISVISLKTGVVESIITPIHSSIFQEYEILHWDKNNQLYVTQTTRKEPAREIFETSLLSIDPFTKKVTFIDGVSQGEHIQMYGIVRAEK